MTATGSTPAQQAARLAMPGSCSYIYVGAPLTDQSSANCIVAWDDPANHKIEGAIVLFADGSAAFEPLTTVVQLVPELEAGHNPPTIVTLSQKEDRWVRIGISSRGRLLVVVYTERNDAIRLISGRRATIGEKADYEQANQ